MYLEKYRGSEIMPKVSVIVPVYNVEDYLKKCLDSLISQTFSDFEVIIVNDGSPDNSQKIIDKYTKKYVNFKGFIKENGGLSDARNYGIKKAKGDFVALVDSDDYVANDFLEKMYNKAIKDNLDIVVCDTVNVYEDGRKQLIKSDLHYSNSNIKNYLLAPPTGCIRLYKRNLLLKEEFKKGILYEDLELVPGLVLQTKKVGFLEEGLYYYLQRSGSIMKQVKFNEKILDIFKVLDVNYQKLTKKYSLEVEYLYITNLLRTTTLRFLEYKNTKKYLKQINDIMTKRFPNWMENIYFKKSSKKLQLACKLAYKKHYFLLRIIKKITNK